jgi:hypothetical protein
MPVMVDVLHLLVIVIGVGVGAWALMALRTALPRGRFIVFTTASVGSLFGCAALSGEVGVLPPVGWFAVVMATMAAIVLTGRRLARAPATWR